MINKNDNPKNINVEIERILFENKDKYINKNLKNSLGKINNDDYESNIHKNKVFKHNRNKKENQLKKESLSYREFNNNNTSNDFSNNYLLTENSDNKRYRNYLLLNQDFNEENFEKRKMYSKELLEENKKLQNLINENENPIIEGKFSEEYINFNTE